MNENPGEHSGENPGEHASETSGSTVAAEKDQQLDGLFALFSDAVNGQRSLAITGIFVMLLFYTLYFAAPVLIPITLALLLNMLLAPGVVLLTRLRIPQALAAACHAPSPFPRPAGFPRPPWAWRRARSARTRPASKTA